MHNDFYSDFKALAYTYRHKLYSFSCSYFSSNFRFLSILPWRPTSGKCKNHLGSLKQMHIAYGICFSYFLICLPHCLKSDLLCVLGSKTKRRIQKQNNKTAWEQKQGNSKCSSFIPALFTHGTTLGLCSLRKYFLRRTCEKKTMSDENSITQRLDIKYSTDRSSFFLSSCGSCNDFCLLMHSFFFSILVSAKSRST